MKGGSGEVEGLCDSLVEMLNVCMMHLVMELKSLALQSTACTGLGEWICAVYPSTHLMVVQGPHCSISSLHCCLATAD